MSEKIIYINLDETYKRSSEELDKAFEEMFDEKEHALSSIKRRHRLLNEAIHRTRNSEQHKSYESSNKEALDEIDQALNELLKD